MCREHVKRLFVLVLVTSLGKQPVCPDNLKVSTTDLCAPMHKLATQASWTQNDRQNIALLIVEGQQMGL
jgi:hypothetical protein